MISLLLLQWVWVLYLQQSQIQTNWQTRKHTNVISNEHTHNTKAHWYSIESHKRTTIFHAKNAQKYPSYRLGGTQNKTQNLPWTYSHMNKLTHKTDKQLHTNARTQKITITLAQTNTDWYRKISEWGQRVLPRLLRDNNLNKRHSHKTDTEEEFKGSLTTIHKP